MTTPPGMFDRILFAIVLVFLAVCISAGPLIMLLIEGR